MIHVVYTHALTFHSNELLVVSRWVTEHIFLMFFRCSTCYSEYYASSVHLLITKKQNKTFHSTSCMINHYVWQQQKTFYKFFSSLAVFLKPSFWFNDTVLLDKQATQWNRAIFHKTGQSYTTRLPRWYNMREAGRLLHPEIFYSLLFMKQHGHIMEEQ